MSNESFAQYDFDSAESFLEALSPRAKSFAVEAPRSWVFRGHGDEEWGLIPSAFRPNSNLITGFAHVGRAWGDWTNLDQIRAEAGTIQRFVEEADGAGLPIPQESHELREQVSAPFTSRYDELIGAGHVEWPPRVAWPLVALVQHYGLATRFLDWTYSSYVAAYFAAVDALNLRRDSGSRLAVWGFSAAARFACWGILSPMGDALPTRFPELVVAPYAGNPNLRAQEGLHVAIRTTKIRPSDPADRSDYSDAFTYVDKFDRGFNRRALLKFTLPTVEAPTLLWYLAKERVTPARLFPGYVGAAQSVLHQRLLRSRDDYPTNT